MNVTVNLTVAQSPLPVIVHVVRGNTEIPVDFHITDYTIPAGSTARFYLKKTSGAEVYNNCTISGNVITLDPTAQTFAEAGCQAAQLQVEIGEDFLLSFPMTLDVAPNIIDDSAIESSSEYGALESLLQEAQENIPAAGEAASAANQAAEAANAAAGVANTATKNANTAAGAANNAASAANTAAGQANTAAGAANTAAGQANTAKDSANTAASAANQATQNANNAAAAVTEQLVPTGGTQNQVLTKGASGPEWSSEINLPGTAGSLNIGDIDYSMTESEYQQLATLLGISTT